MKTKKISADEAQGLRKNQMRSTPKGELLMKAAKGKPASYNADERRARFVMSAEVIDRYGDIIVTDGISTEEFERNPVGLLFHKSSSWPIGHWENLEKKTTGRPRRLEGDLVLLPAEGPVPEIDQAAWMIANGGIRACSIGFIPKWDEVERIDDDEGHFLGLKFFGAELLECSVCAIPANPAALVKAAQEIGGAQLATEILEDVLDNWVRSPTGLMMDRRTFEEQYAIVARDGADAPTQVVVSASGVDAIPNQSLSANVIADSNQVAENISEVELSAEEPTQGDTAHPSAKPVGPALQPVPAHPVNEPPPPVPAEKLVGAGITTAVLRTDTSGVEKELDRLEEKASRVAAFIQRIFGRGAPAAEPERIEPTPMAPPAPTAEQIAAAQERVRAVQERFQKRAA